MRHEMGRVQQARDVTAASGHEEWKCDWMPDMAKERGRTQPALFCDPRRGESERA